MRIALVILAIVCMGIVLPPPIPPKTVIPHKSAAIHQGDGAAKLIAKVVAVIPPAPITNSIVWQYPDNIEPSNYWWNIETTTDLQTWTVVVSNATGWLYIPINPAEPLRIYRLSGRLTQ